MESPLEQFRVKSIGDPILFAGHQISFNNAALWMMIAVVAVAVFMIAGIRRRSMVPSAWQVLVEMSYEFVSSMVRDNVGQDGKVYFPFIFSMFMFILFGNFFGILPSSFTFTSQIAVTASFALFVFLGATLIGIVKHRFRFFKLFIVTGIPVALVPLLFVIEIVSYLSRPVSLSIRLFVNMMAGHTMVMVFAGFVFSLGAITFGIGGLLPIAAGSALLVFELLVAALQAYVFTILSCIYLNDAIHLH